MARACASARGAMPWTVAPRRSGRRSRITGLSAVIGSWKISEMPAPRTCAHLALGQREQVAALEEDLPAGDPAGRLQQAQDRERRDRLAAARFADQAQRLAWCNLEADASTAVAARRSAT